MEKIKWFLLISFITLLSFNPSLTNADCISFKGEFVLVENEVLQEADKKAQFPGGEKAMKIWLKENLDYPKDAKRYGSVIVTFTVKKNGSLSDFKVQKGVNETLDIAAVEILRGMPKWEPAVKGGKKVNSLVQLPVKFVPKVD